MSDKAESKGGLVLGKTLLFCLLCAFILVTTSRVTQNLPPFINVGIACFATMFLTICFTGFDRQRLTEIGVLPGVRTSVRVLLGFSIGFLLAALQMLTVMIDGHTSMSISTDANISAIALAFLLYLFVALREELAFRGYPLRKLDYSMGPLAAQSIVAVIFIIEHYVGGMNWWQSILGPGIGAILFGMAALRSKGIALSFGLHFAWNFGQWTLGFKDQGGIIKVVVEAGYESRTELFGWIGYILAMVLGLIAVCFWKRPTSSE